MNWAYNLLVSLDQLFNTIAGGNPDVTISSHCATMTHTAKGKWETLSKIVDTTFAPIEPDHCYNSMLADDDLDETDNFISTAFVVVCGCFLLYIPIRIIKLYEELLCSG